MLQGAQLQQAQAHLGQSDTDFQQLQSVVKASTEEVKKVQNEKVDLEKEKKEALATKEQLSKSLEVIKAQNKSLEAQIEDITKKLKLIQDENDLLEETDKKEDETMVQMGKTLKELRATLIQVQKEKEDIEKALHDTKEAQKKVESANKQMTAKLQRNNEELENSRKGINNLIKNLERMSQSIIHNKEFKITDDLPCGVSKSFMDLYNKLKGFTGPFKNATCYLIYFIKFFNKILFDGRSSLLRAVKRNAERMPGKPYDNMDSVFSLLRHAASSDEGVYHLKDLDSSILDLIYPENPDDLRDLQNSLDSVFDMPPVNFKKSGSDLIFVHDDTKQYTHYTEISNGVTEHKLGSFDNTSNTVDYTYMLCIFIVLGNKFLETIPEEVKKCGLEGAFPLGADKIRSITPLELPIPEPQAYNPKPQRLPISTPKIRKPKPQQLPIATPEIYQPEIRQPEPQQLPLPPPASPEIRTPEPQQLPVRTPEIRQPKPQQLPVRTPEIRQPEIRQPEPQPLPLPPAAPQIRQPEPQQLPVRTPEIRQPEIRQPQPQQLPLPPPASPEIRQPEPQPLPLPPPASPEIRQPQPQQLPLPTPQARLPVPPPPVPNRKPKLKLIGGSASATIYAILQQIHQGAGDSIVDHLLKADLKAYDSRIRERITKAKGREKAEWKDILKDSAVVNLTNKHGAYRDYWNGATIFTEPYNEFALKEPKMPQILQKYKDAFASTWKSFVKRFNLQRNTKDHEKAKGYLRMLIYDLMFGYAHQYDIDGYPTLEGKASTTFDEVKKLIGDIHLPNTDGKGTAPLYSLNMFQMLGITKADAVNYILSKGDKDLTYLEFMNCYKNYTAKSPPKYPLLK
jgi:hypothetical protein